MQTSIFSPGKNEPWQVNKLQKALLLLFLLAQVNVYSQINNWIGNTSSDWFTSSNWSAGIPTATSDVYISSGANYYPQISSGAAVAKSVHVAASTSFSINGGSLSGADLLINGNFLLSANALLTMESKQISGTGTATINGILNTKRTEGFNGSANTTWVNGTLNLVLGASSTIEYSSESNQTITAFSYANLKSSGNGNRQLSSTGIIRVSGSFTSGTNSYSIGNSEIELNGLSPQLLPTLTVNSGANFNRLVINNPSGVSVNSDVSIKESLLLNRGTLTSNGHSFTLLSDANQTASIAAFSDGAFVGNITLQRYIPAAVEGWVNIALPVKKATIAALNDDLITYGFVGANSGMGANSSILTYDESVAAPFADPTSFVAPLSSNDSINPLRGYWVYVTNNGASAADKLIDISGELNSGRQEFAISYTNTAYGPDEDGWNLIANPYPSAIDWNSPAWTKSNIDNAIYVYDAEIGQFVGEVGGVKFNKGSNLIASSQSFWIHANAASPSLVAVEAVKANSNANYYKTTGEISSGLLRIQLNESNGNYADETVVQVKSGASEYFDTEFDAYKLTSLDASKPGISTYLFGKNFAVNTIGELQNDFDLSLRVQVRTAGNYQLNFKGLQNFAGMNCFLLEDLITSDIVDLKMDSTYTFSSGIDTAGFPRFMLHFGVIGVQASMIPSQTTLNLFSNPTVCFTNTSIGASNISWDFGDGSPLDWSLNPCHTYTTLGTFTVTLTASNITKCSQTNSTQITVNTVTGSETNQASESIGISKESTQLYANYNFANNTKVVFKLFNLLGEQIGEAQVEQLQNSGRIPLLFALPVNGIYTLELFYNNTRITKKIIN